LFYLVHIKNDYRYDMFIFLFIFVNNKNKNEIDYVKNRLYYYECKITKIGNFIKKTYYWFKKKDI
jgi:hypothetical protein